MGPHDHLDFFLDVINGQSLKSFNRSDMEKMLQFSSNRGRCRQRRSETIVTVGSVMMGNLNYIISEVVVREEKKGANLITPRR